MATSRISEADAARDLPGLLARVSAGEEIIIESSFGPVAVLRGQAPRPRSPEEILARLPDDSPATIDEDFAADVAAVVAGHRESLAPSHRTIREVLFTLPGDDTMRMGPDFADDVEAAIAAHREPLDPPDCAG